MLVGVLPCGDGAALLETRRNQQLAARRRDLIDAAANVLKGRERAVNIRLFHDGFGGVVRHARQRGIVALIGLMVRQSRGQHKVAALGRLGNPLLQLVFRRVDLP